MPELIHRWHLIEEKDLEILLALMQDDELREKTRNRTSRIPNGFIFDEHSINEYFNDALHEVAAEEGFDTAHITQETLDKLFEAVFLEICTGHFDPMWTQVRENVEELAKEQIREAVVTGEIEPWATHFHVDKSQRHISDKQEVPIYGEGDNAGMVGRIYPHVQLFSRYTDGDGKPHHTAVFQIAPDPLVEEGDEEPAGPDFMEHATQVLRWLIGRFSLDHLRLQVFFRQRPEDDTHPWVRLRYNGTAAEIGPHTTTEAVQREIEPAFGKEDL